MLWTCLTISRWANTVCTDSLFRDEAITNQTHSQNSPACHVLDSMLGHCLRWLHQLRRHGFHCHLQRSIARRGRRQLIMEWCNYAILQHQRDRLGSCFIPLQGGTNILHGSRRPRDWHDSGHRTPRLPSRTSPLSAISNSIKPLANISSVRAQHPRRLHLCAEPPSAHPVRRLPSLQPDSDLCGPELDRMRLLYAVLPPQLPTWVLQGLRLHDHGRFRRSKSLRALHSVVCCVWRCWSISSVPAVVGQQCCG